ncbi:MAG: GIY-YIG nuclease family protein [Oscillospiraceae bacterium]|nr:GIY-YIG nuclease family protein [Oscillospiraceae bacterium]
MSWWVYLLRCADGSLYTGITTDVERRTAQHNAGTGAKYTRSRGPVVPVFREEGPTKGEALRREAAIKRLPRQEKLKLIQTSPQKVLPSSKTDLN